MTTDILNNPWKNPPNNTAFFSGELGHDTDDILLKKLNSAKDDIEENEKVKEKSLTQLREWIKQNKDIENCLTDDNFLLRFLRTKKFSLFMAQQMILKYLNFRKKFSRFMNLLDFQEENTLELLTKGYIFASPFRDSSGRRVIIYNVDKFDLQKYSDIDMGRAHAVTYEAVIQDEETQILGVNHVADLSGISAAFTTLFSVTDFTRIITWGEQSFPMRHKEINLMNVPTPLKYIYDYALSKMSKKLSERFVMHDSLSSLHKQVDVECLPLEMGGNMPLAEMIELWRNELKEKRGRLLSLSKINLLSDRGIISRKTIAEHTANSNMEGLTGSFRQLEVD